MLSDDEKAKRVKKDGDIPLRRAVRAKMMDWARFRANNTSRFVGVCGMVIQVLADICCLLLSFVRGSWMSWAVNPLLILLACFGIFGALRVEPVSLFIHSIGCYIGLLIIVIGCGVDYAKNKESVVFAIHAPGVVDLICAFLTLFMAVSIVGCGCCGRCLCLNTMPRGDDGENAPGNANAGAPATAAMPSAPPEPVQNRQESNADCSCASEQVEMEPAVNFDDMDDESKMRYLEQQQQQKKKKKKKEENQSE